mgnify:CR=1 FL=1
MANDLYMQVLISAVAFAGVFVLVRFGWPEVRLILLRLESRLDTVLNRQLLMDTDPRMALVLFAAAVFVAGLVGYALIGNYIGFIVAAGIVAFLPNVLLNHLEQKRKQKLNEQIVDGITSLASGVRAGLTLVQAMQLLVQNSTGPIKQEFTHLLREYELGVDLNQAMQNASDRIATSHYRLLFSAVAAHRTRGGDLSQSLDRITDAIREIQRLEGKLQTLTAQGRNQAWMMAGMAIIVLGIGYMIAPEATQNVLSDDMGRVILLVALGLIVLGALWIRKIMSVDI